MTWTEEQARALITDSGTLKRGQELAAPAKWGNLGQTDTAAWGECKGSGSKPYQTGIDLTAPAFKCSCPSRVFPCKHGAGLLLLLARQPQLLSGTTPPTWLQEWLDKRQQTQEKQVAKAEPTAAPATDSGAAEAARQKREAQRQTRMQRGAQELETWLVDIMRAGLAATDQQPRTFWENQAARLVDNQLPGLATVVRELPTLRHQGPDWPARLLARLGELYLLVRAFLRLPELSEEARQEVLQQVGVNLKKEDVQATQPPVADEWRVLAQTTTEEERLTVRRSWLRGQQTERFALVVEFSFGGQAFATPLLPDGSYAGELTFYPGLLPLRAIPGPLTFLGIQPGNPLPAGGIGPHQLLNDYADALSRLPWLREWPALLKGGVPTPVVDGWVLRFSSAPTNVENPVDSTSPEQHFTDLPLLCDDLSGWELRAISGGQPLTVFGEWTGQVLRPLVGWNTVVEPAKSLVDA
ncbi:SWIM zinc finger family protein [Hymenobacter lutimineralis]|uniref:SWIM zinc finger family protein n=1 Tax=Hymenobacter lutimineralis TaxID=2606448 RepID=A0A5D6UTD7_9BACT|nr:SWIM zinc finger family protein [Hymenobacter lutimineralis]TYZ05902.1 SWIM zinc finger family protein [Hymenobacter lutimineralis]